MIQRCLLGVCLVCAACARRGTDIAPQGSTSPSAALSETASASRPPVPPRQVPSAAAFTLRELEGRWRVSSSSGVRTGGAAFTPLIGKVITIVGNRMTFEEHASDAIGNPMTYTTTKVLSLSEGTWPQAIDIRQPGEAKGWSRVGIVMRSNDTLTLSVNFPQNPRPDHFEPKDDGREVVALERVGPPSTEPRSTATAPH
jgi:hypothetical protein